MVNDELEQLADFLENLPRWLRPGGRVAVISYHSLEDRLVKQAFNKLAKPCTCPPDLPVCVCGRKPIFTLAPKKALRPSPQEVAENPRARSARLRVAVRTTEAVS
jgi:16S rRNA (cytosine1402-N4)-methyltransferase